MLNVVACPKFHFYFNAFGLYQLNYRGNHNHFKRNYVNNINQQCPDVRISYIILAKVLKRITIWLLIFAVFIANFSTAFVYLGFKLNQQYVAQHLCVNRYKPGLHCNGHCYFMQKIKQAEDNEKKQTAKNSSVRLEISFFEEPFRMSFLGPVLLENDKIRFPNFNYQYTSQYLDSIFRPPKSLV